MTYPEDLIFPIGQDLGPYHPAPGEPASYYEICVGRTSYGLPTIYDYAVWKHANGPVDDPPLTYSTFRDGLVKAEIPDGEQLALRLAANGLLWQVSPAGDDAVKFSLAHRIMPLLTAIGTTGADVPPGRYALGRPSAVYYYADELEYWLWLWGGRFDSIWLACEALARTDLGARTGEGDPERCIAPLIVGLQKLVTHSLVFLDAAWDRR